MFNLLGFTTDSLDWQGYTLGAVPHDTVSQSLYNAQQYEERPHVRHPLLHRGQRPGRDDAGRLSARASRAACAELLWPMEVPPQPSAKLLPRSWASRRAGEAVQPRR